MPNIPIGGDDSIAVGDETGGDDAVVLRGVGIEKTYDSWLPWRRGVEVLDGVDLEVCAGEIVGIVGANGSGKSTLMQILVGARDADAGSVARSGRVGWCPQETLLYDRLTVAETFDLFGAAYGLSEEVIDDARARLADRLDFERFLDYQVRHLSGGNRQKVNLAVALLHDPDVLLLDEPYTGFDWETYLAFWQLTEELTERGTAIAIISHFVSERERFDRIYELRDGDLVESDGESGTAGEGAGPGASPDGTATGAPPDGTGAERSTDGTDADEGAATDPTEVA
ncbi:ABC transporter ATP-binding protein [Halosimplex amylolyticum]|uniref:ABC transporter ATP-binding protein n=1 Tax=Halosimplex amylolyticum TaxID=3396616 RepID=UPI003F550F72